MRSKAPGRMFWMKTSAEAASFFSVAAALGSLRSSTTPFFPRFCDRGQGVREGHRVA